MKRSLQIIRTMHRTGQHLYDCFADVRVRNEGWRMMSRARRIARRLGIAAFLSVLLIVQSGRSEIPPGYAERVADAIWLAEGGSHTKWPYGVKSIKCGSVAEARRITINSVRNNWRRWEVAGKPGEFVPWMAARWCPVAADAVGNMNWTVNVGRKLKGKI